MTVLTYFMASLKQPIVLDWLKSFFLRSNVTLLSYFSTWCFSVVLKP